MKQEILDLPHKSLIEMKKMRLAKFILRLEDFLLRLALGANARRKIYFASRILIS